MLDMMRKRRFFPTKVTLVTLRFSGSRSISITFTSQLKQEAPLKYLLELKKLPMETNKSK